MASLLSAALACAGPPVSSHVASRAAPPQAEMALVTEDPAGACARCHRAEADEWRASLHRVAFTDRDFQAAFALEPLDFCFGCHAPEASGRSDERGLGRGVGCLSCHETAPGHGEVHTTATTRSCAPCHEFAFPGREAFMQSTVAEHARSPLSGTPCASCHLPRALDGHRDHRFDVSRSPAVLRAALQVDARLTRAGVSIDLATRGVGHAMPTGDLFRQLRIVVRAESRDGRPEGEEEVVLGRRFESRHGVVEPEEDSRIEGARHVELTRAWLERAARVIVTVRYDRVAHAREVVDVRGVRRRHDVLYASVLLSETTLEPPGEPAR